MDTQMLNALNETQVAEMLWTLGVLLRIFSVLAVGCLAVYLDGVAWLCYEELRQAKARVKRVADRGGVCASRSPALRRALAVARKS